jgi:predicted MPP superfamily phosphohydrolase
MMRALSPERPTRRMFLRTAAIAVAAVATPSIVRATNARLRVTRHKIPWNVEQPVRILQLTDVHVGWTTPKQILDDAVEVAHRLKPSLVALTGDYVNHSLKHVDRLSAFIARLPQPVFATLGNHDHWSGAKGVTEALEKGGARVLFNELVELDVGGFKMPVIGFDDGRTDNADAAKAFSKLAKGAHPLVLTHYPNTADDAAVRAPSFVIAGHTHGGQVHVPGVTRWFSRMAGHRYLAGMYALEDQGHLYVSAGIGASLDGLRGGRAAMPEIAVYDLMPRATLPEQKSQVAWFDGKRLGRFETMSERYDHVLRAVSDDL